MDSGDENAVPVFSDLVKVGAGAFLGGLGGRALERLREHGRALVDRFEARFVERFGKKKAPIPARALIEAIEAVSWVDDEAVREMWVGLLGSRSRGREPDDVTLGYVRMLNMLTPPECRLLAAGCKLAAKVYSPPQFLFAAEVRCNWRSAMCLAGLRSLGRLDAHLDRMRGLRLGEFMVESDHDGVEGVVNLTPSPWALGLYTRCEGSSLSPLSFFKGEVVRTRYSSWGAGSRHNAVWFEAKKRRDGAIACERYQAPNPANVGVVPPFDTVMLATVRSKRSHRRKRK